ncbi:MAG: hypothetical protein AABZ47_08290 [Planctomycetota bacterium]
MTDVSTIAPATDRSRGRGLLWAGIAVGLLGVPLYCVQITMGMLTVPWYQPAMATLGALLLLRAVARRRSITRVIALVVIAVFAGLDWYLVVSVSKLPSYEGPARVGQKMPAFSTAKADGGPFTEKDLQDGKFKVLVFNRGRW